MSIRTFIIQTVVVLFIFMQEKIMCETNLTGNPAIDVPQFHCPLPEKYADEKRMFQGIPSIAASDDNNLWAVWYTGGITEDRDNLVVVARSRDGGVTWSKPLFCLELPNDIRMFDPSIWYAPDGKIHLYWSASHQLWTMHADNPNSDEPVWSAPQYVAPGVAMNKAIVDSRGRWLIPVSVWNCPYGPTKDHTPEGPSGAWIVVSEDQGKTYHQLGRGYTPPDIALFDEHSVVELKDGRFWILNRTRKGVGQFFSEDGGKTWSDFAASPIKHTSSRFFLRRLQSGKIILVKHGDIDQDCGRSQLKAFVSDDEGKTWRGGLLLDPRSGISYPDGDQTPDGRIHIIYDFDRYGMKVIHHAVITETDILAGHLCSPGSFLGGVINHASGIHPDYLMKDNADGIAFSDQLAPFTGADEQNAPADFAKGTLLFSDRKYVLNAMKPPFLNRRFIRAAMNNGVRAVCEADGMATVLTPLPKRNRDSQEKLLLEQGFRKTNVPEFSLFGDIHFGGLGNVVSVFQKPVRKGDVVELGKWGVLVY